MISPNEKTIFGRLAYQLCEEILQGNYKADDRLPSVRELAVMYEVNYNTILRTMEVLQREEIIYQKRGIGYFVCADARKRLLKGQKEDFKCQQLPELFRQARMLGISIDEIVEVWNATQ